MDSWASTAVEFPVCLCLCVLLCVYKCVLCWLWLHHLQQVEQASPVPSLWSWSWSHLVTDLWQNPENSESWNLFYSRSSILKHWFLFLLIYAMCFGRYILQSFSCFCPCRWFILSLNFFFSSLWYIVTVCSEKMSDSDFWKVFLSESTYFWPPSSVWSPCLSGLRDGSNGLGMMSILGLDILPNEGSSMWKKKSLNCLILGYLHAISPSLSPQRLILQSSYSESFWPVTYRHFFEKVGHYWNTFRYVLWFLKSDVDFNF